MKFTKTLIRVWIATTSVVGFLGAWGFLSHSPKPAPLINQPTVSLSSPVDNLQILSLGQSENSFSSLQQMPTFSIGQSPFSQLRTRGS
jgi:hypothetical protein